MPTVVVSRHNVYAGRARSMKVTAGPARGRVPARGETRLDVPDGPLEVRASLDWCRSPVVRVELVGDDELHLRTAMSANIALLFYAPGRVVSLEVDAEATRRSGTGPDVLDRVTVEAGPRRLPTGLATLALVIAAAVVSAWVVLVPLG